MANEERREDQMNTKDFVIGALVGGIVGAATALFLAPKSGRELREDLNGQASVLKEKTNQIRESAMTHGSALAAAAKEKTNVVTQAVQSNDWVNKVKTLKTENEQEFEEAAEAEAESIEVEEANYDVQQKLEETKKAFDETEQILNK
jgi:gas vesicle protein